VKGGSFSVCASAFNSAIGIGSALAANLHHAVALGGSGDAIQHKSKGIKKPQSSQCLTFSTFVTWYIKNYCQHHPETGAMTLPYAYTYRSMWQLYVQDCKKHDLRPYEYDTFTRKLHEDFPLVKLSHLSDDFHCTTCKSIDQDIENALHERRFDDSQFHRHRKQAHMDWSDGERAKYYKHKRKTRDNPDKYVCLIIDGMDQAKMTVPSLTKRPDVKDLAIHFPMMHTTAARLADGTTYYYLNYDNIAKDGSFIPNVVLRTVSKILQARSGKPLPEVMYLQLDNTARENKNRYVFSFLSLLVQKKIFKKIKVNFLPVGHTHEDVDQGFSVVSGLVKERRPRSPSEMVSLLRSIPKVAGVDVITDVLDTKAWLLGCWHEKSLTDFSQCLQARFSLTPKSTTGVSSQGSLCSIQMRASSSSTTPYEPQGSGALLLQRLPSTPLTLVSLRPIGCGTEEELRRTPTEEWTLKLDRINIHLETLKSKGYLGTATDYPVIQESWDEFLSFQRRLRDEGLIGAVGRATSEALDAEVATCIQMLQYVRVDGFALQPQSRATILAAAEEAAGGTAWNRDCTLPSSVDAILPEPEGVLDLYNVGRFIVQLAEAPRSGDRHPTVASVKRGKHKDAGKDQVTCPGFHIYVGQVASAPREGQGTSSSDESGLFVDIHWWCSNNGYAGGIWQPLRWDTGGVNIGVSCEGEPYMTTIPATMSTVATTFVNWTEHRDTTGTVTSKFPISALHATKSRFYAQYSADIHSG